MTFFGGNPFNTLVGQKIEQATEASLASENWALNMEICDIINDTEEGAKDAVKAMRKRLVQNAGKNYTVVMYTLTVLETSVKNCGRKFHLLATSKEFVQELVKLIGPKNDPPTAVQEKVLSLIQSWADAFKGNPEMCGVVQVYQDLRQKGVEFPMTDLDAMAPIHTPTRTISESEQGPKPVVAPTVQPARPVSLIQNDVLTLTAEQMTKLRSELDIVRGNMRIFGEMLVELVPGREHPSDIELLLDLNKTCKSMQTRVVELLDRVGGSNEEVTNELLRINDEMNNLFLRYSRFEKNRPAPVQTPPATVPDKPLIDLDESEVQLQMGNLGMSNVPNSSGDAQPAADDEFDMFAQSRTLTYEKSKNSGSSYEDNSRVDQSEKSLGSIAVNRSAGLPQEETLDETLQSEHDFDEMEAWLKGQPSNLPPNPERQSVSNSEFDRFLAERAAVRESATPRGNGARRQLEKEETENTLFAL